MNIFSELNGKDLPKDFNWLNEPGQWNFNNGILEITAPANTDFFNDPEGNISNSAPYFYTYAEGDFELTTQIDIKMEQMFDAAAVLILSDSDNWAKFAYENWINEPSVVSVVTRKYSDDCPSLRIGTISPFLRVLRSGDCFGLHYSPDGINWTIIRFFHLDVPKRIKVGITAQSPMGNSCRAGFRLFDLKQTKIQTAKFVSQ